MTGISSPISTAVFKFFYLRKTLNIQCQIQSDTENRAQTILQAQGSARSGILYSLLPEVFHSGFCRLYLALWSLFESRSLNQAIGDQLLEERGHLFVSGCIDVRNGIRVGVSCLVESTGNLSPFVVHQ